MASQRDSTIIFWDLNSRNPIRQWKITPFAVKLLAFTPRGECLASAHETGNFVYIWNTFNGERSGTINLRKPLHPEHGLEVGVAALVWSLDGATLIIATTPLESPSHREFPSTFSIVIWDARALEPLHIISDRISSEIGHLVISPDNQLVLSCESSGNPLLWDFHTGQLHVELLTGDGHDDTTLIDVIAFNDSGTMLIAVDNLGRCLHWSTMTGQILLCVQLAHEPAMPSTNLGGSPMSALSRCGSYVVWKRRNKLSEDRLNFSTGEVYISDTTTGTTLSKFEAPDLRNVGYPLAISPDGQYVAASTRDYALRLWGVREGRFVTEIFKFGRVPPFSKHTFSADGRYLVSGLWDGTVRISPIHELVAGTLRWW